MYYALVYYLEEYPAAVDTFRKKYDSRFLLVAPHLTFVFPVDAALDQEMLIDHVSMILHEQVAFEVVFSGISRSWDNLVFLLTQQGTREIIAVHDKLYSGLLQPFLRSDIEYIPHVTLGTAHSEETLTEAEEFSIHFSATIDKLTLIKRENESSPMVWSKEFFLK